MIIGLNHLQVEVFEYSKRGPSYASSLIFHCWTKDPVDRVRVRVPLPTGTVALSWLSGLCVPATAGGGVYTPGRASQAEKVKE